MRSSEMPATNGFCLSAHDSPRRLPCRESWTVGLAILALAEAVWAGQLQPARLPVQSGRPLTALLSCRQMRADARLADVHFVDRQYGWAVGDRGTIWHTEDGGQHWYLQSSGVVCPLRSVLFLDRSVGFAAGGWTEPYTLADAGVLLVTRDGGRHWARVAQQLLPGLRQARWLDAHHAWAIGCSSQLFPSGLVLSEDGGVHWLAVPGAEPGGWLAADFIGPHEGALASWQGRTAVVRPGGRGIQPSHSPSFGPRQVHRIALVPPRYGWLVGDGGLVMMTADLGMTWRNPPGPLPPGASQHFDFLALAVRGPKAWIAGSPGTRILHSPDAGQSWQWLPTGQNMPIHALCFVDDQFGWAVGELGTILATTDGGRSWHPQRSGGRRAAVLGVFASAEQIPLETLASVSGDEGYLSAVEVIGRRRGPQAASRPPLPERAHEAVVQVGGSSCHHAWQFPLPDPQLTNSEAQVIAHWDRVHDGRGMAELETYLVRLIRLWRPEVVIVPAGEGVMNGPADRLLRQATVAAVQRAADPTWQAEQISLAGLAPWRVKRVFGLLGPGQRGTITITPTELATRWGRTLGEVAFMARGIIAPSTGPVDEPVGFRLLADHTGGAPPARFFSGIALPAGSDARRELPAPSPEAVAHFRHLSQKRRNAQAILGRLERTPQGGVELAAQLGDLTGGLDPDSAAQLIYLLARRYVETGHWPQAAELFDFLGRRYAGHPLGRAALVWLVQYYGSSEAAWRIEGPQRVTVQAVSAPALDFSAIEDRLERAASVAKQLAAADPRLAADPRIGFALASVNRRRGFPGDAKRFYLARSRGAVQDDWALCARGERWLAEPEGIPPKPLLRCARAEAKPRLDGQLDEPLWQQAEAAQLEPRTGPGRGWPARVLLAYDDEFLYFAVDAQRAPGVEYAASEGPRPYDGDLSGHDRVDLLLDVDRDFATFYRLTVDHRGWTGDACWGDRSWNPRWFVAAGGDTGRWTAEVAVPMDQLTGRYPDSGTVWAVGIQRIVPGAGFQSWSAPASPSVEPAGFGYLIFQ